MLNIAKLTKTKSPQDLIDEVSSSQNTLKRSLNAIDLVAFGIGATIGSGIFALVGQACAGSSSASIVNWIDTPAINTILHLTTQSQPAGPSIVVSFILAAIACGFAALCYAELASMIPISGSAYTYAYACLGEFSAWIIGWNLILEYIVGNIAVSISWSEHLVKLAYELFNIKLPLFLTGNLSDVQAKMANLKNNHNALDFYSNTNIPNILGHEFAVNLPALIIVTLITILLVKGAKESATINKIILSLTFSAILYFIIYGSTQINSHNWYPFAPGGISGILSASAIVFFSFIGFDAVSSLAEETKNPQKDLPIGMIGSLVVCTIIYSLTAIVLTGIKPYQFFANDSAPLALAMIICKNHFGSILISIGALASMTSVLLVFQMGLPRIVMVMSRDGLIPKSLASLHPKYKTPHIATIAMGLLIGLAVIVMDIRDAAELTNIGTLAVFALVCLGVLILRKTSPSIKRGFSCPLVPLIPIAGILTCLILMLSLNIKIWLYYLIFLTIGLIVYFTYGYRKN